MPERHKSSNGSTRTRRPPARTMEQRELELSGKALDLAEKQIEKGTASAQVITHFLKLATVRNQLEIDKINAEVKLAEAKIASLGDSKELAVMYKAAMKKMGVYQGMDEDEDDDEENVS